MGLYTRHSLSKFLFVFAPLWLPSLLVLLALALWLRWQYVVEVGLYIDEFTTLWASQHILERGAPIMPSGVFYTRGVLSTYVIAAFAAVGGLTTTIGRLPSVIFGLASILAIFYIGRREWNIHVGWLAAVAFVVLPEAIEASGRARFYAQLLFFVLLTIWAAYVAIQKEVESNVEAARSHLFFAVCFVLALFSQEETILLYPSILLGMLLWRGWRYLLRPPVLSAQLICIVAMGLRYALEQFGQPGYFDTIQSHKPYIEFHFEIFEAWSEYGGLLIPMPRLPWTLFGLLAIMVSLVELRRVGWRLAQLPRFHQATLFFTMQFMAVLLPLLTVIGWREDRYLWIVQPCWLLVGAAGAMWLVHRLVMQPAPRWLVTGLLTPLIVWSLWPQATGILTVQPDGYDQAFDYVATHQQANDIIMSPQPPACAFVLGEACDYYARQEGYEPYVIANNGVLMDRWSGAKLLDQTEELEALIRQAPAVWFVTDPHRLGSRYYSDFVRLVIEQFDVVFEERNVKVLLAKGWREQPNYVVKKSFDPPIPIDELRLMGWERSEVIPGEESHMILLWGRNEYIYEQINSSLQLVASDTTRVTQADGPLARGIISPFGRARALLPDLKTLTLPDDLPKGRYRLEIIAYTLAPYTPLSDPIVVEWLRVGPPPVAPTQKLDIGWQNGLTLVGYDDDLRALSPNEPLTMRLVWMTTQPLPTDYTMFLHLIGPEGQIVAQSDQAPENGFYPTSSWVIGDLVEENYTLQLPPDLVAGGYRLLVGLYQPENGQRLRLTGLREGSDALELGQWIVE